MSRLHDAIRGALKNGNPSPAVLEWVLDLASRGKDTELAYAAAAHPNLPAARAAKLSGADAAFPVDLAALAGYLSRPDVAEEHLRCVAVLPRTHTGRQWLTALIEDPGTSAKVLERAAAFVSALGKWHLLYLQHHPNANADSVAACWVHAVQRQPRLCRPGELFNATEALVKSQLPQVHPSHLAAAFDRIDHPVALLQIAETFPDGPTRSQLRRLVTYTVLDSRLRSQIRTTKLGKTHLFTRVAALVKTHNTDPDLAEQCIAAFEGYLLHAQTPQQAFARDVVDTRDHLTKIAGRKLDPLLRAAKHDPSAGAGMAAALNAIAQTPDPAATLMLFERLAEEYPGTLGEFVDVCRTAATT